MSIVPDSYGRRLVTQFENTVRAHAFKGAGHPEDEPYVVEAYEKARARLVRRLDEHALRSCDLQEHVNSCISALGYDPWDEDPYREHEK